MKKLSVPKHLLVTRSWVCQMPADLVTSSVMDSDVDVENIALGISAPGVALPQ